MVWISACKSSGLSCCAASAVTLSLPAGPRAKQSPTPSCVDRSVSTPIQGSHTSHSFACLLPSSPSHCLSHPDPAACIVTLFPSYFFCYFFLLYFQSILLLLLFLQIFSSSTHTSIFLHSFLHLIFYFCILIASAHSLLLLPTRASSLVVPLPDTR